MRKFIAFAAILGVLATAGCNNSNQSSGAPAAPIKPPTLNSSAPPSAAAKFPGGVIQGGGPASAPAPSGN